MPSTLPTELQQAAERYLTSEFVTIDANGRPIVWPVTPYFRAGEGCIDVTTGVGYPKKADDAARNPHVALLFSDPTGSGMAGAPMVLVQGTARVDDTDLDANRERYEREMADKLPALHALAPTGALKRFFSWYYDRIYLHVRPERVYVWTGAALDVEPTLYDAHVEEVRSGHNQEPEEGHVPPEGGLDVWDTRLDRLGREDATAVLAIVGPDGFPFAVRVPVRADAAACVVHVEADPVGAPIDAGPGVPVRALPRRRPHLAAQLPGPRRPGRAGRPPRPASAPRRRGAAAAVVGVRALPRQRAQDPALPQDGPRARAGPRGRRRGELNAATGPEAGRPQTVTSVTGTPKRRRASPTTSSSR